MLLLLRTLMLLSLLQLLLRAVTQPRVHRGTRADRSALHARHHALERGGVVQSRLQRERRLWLCGHK
jgi:hypothetical protein